MTGRIFKILLGNIDVMNKEISAMLGGEKQKHRKRIVVTGATGFIGRNIVTDLLKSGNKVAVLARNPDKARKFFNSKDVEVYAFDISTHSATAELKNFDLLIHCAWDHVTDHDAIEHVEKNYIEHYEFLKSVVAIGIKKIMVMGTCYEYGCQYGPITTGAHTAPVTSYGLAKDMLHKSLRLLQRITPFELVWIRLFYVYGDGQSPDSIIPQFDAALERGDDSFNMSGGEQLLDYLSVEQVTEKITTLLDANDGVYNVSSGKPTSLRKILEQRMVNKNKIIKLNLGYYRYRDNDSLAMWGVSSV